MPLSSIFAALLLPPLAVFLDEGLTRTFWIAAALTCIGFVPGMIFAFSWLIRKRKAVAQPA